MKQLNIMRFNSVIAVLSILLAAGAFLAGITFWNPFDRKDEDVEKKLDLSPNDKAVQQK